MNTKQFRYYILVFLLLTTFTGYSADYFWVGGSGNWSDLSHWATTSGGGTGHVQVPTAADNVFFDANSFTGVADVVTLNSDNIFFRNMTWDPSITGVSLVGGEQVTVSVFGVFELSPNMNYAFEGSLIFSSIEGDFQIINGHGFELGKDVLFDSQGGKWSVVSDFAVDSLFRIQDGIIAIEPNNTVTTAYLEVDIDTEASLLLDGNMIVTGNDYEHLFQPKYTIEIDATNFVLATSTASLVTLTGDQATIFANGTGATLFNYVDFTNPAGISSIQSEPTVQTVINRVQYGSNGYTKGNVQMMELILAPSKSYSWEPGFDYNIEIFNAVGTCSAPITLQSSIPGETVLFNNSSGAIGPVTGEFLNIRDINISSGAFEVNNSLDLGNTTGWVINERVGTDLYWVGGNGDWDDASHWAMTSGGVGGACIPSANDNVFFDSNSFNAAGQTVNLNIDDAFCKTMDWTGVTGTPNFNSNNMNLHINGSLLLNLDMNVNFTGDIYFESDITGNVVISFGKIFQGSLYKTGSGELALGDDFEIGQDIIHNAGIFETNGFTATMTDYRSESDLPRTLIIANSTFRLRWVDGNGPEFVIRGSLFNIQADGSTIEFLDNGYLSLINTMSLEFNRVIFYGYGGIGNYENLNLGVNESRFKYVDFHIWGDVPSIVLFDTLKAQPGTRLLFQSSQTVKVEYLDARGTCERPINLVSNNTGTAAIVETTSTNSDIEYAYVQDIHVNGSGSFTATASVDIGNNVGWNITEEGSRTLYWVGDSGNWNDIAHWSLTSGGPGGECVPTPADDVVFDANSFSLADQTVDGGFCYFRNMTWADIDDVARINWDRSFTYGSIYLSDLVQIDRWNGVALSGSRADSELDFKDKQIGFMELDAEVTGEWTVISDMRFYDGFFFRSGIFNFGDHTFNMERLSTGGSRDLTINLGNAEVFIHGEYTFNPPLASWRNEVFNLDPGNSNIHLTNARTGIRFNAVAFPLNNVRATDANGVATILVDNFNSISGVFNKVQFDGDAIIDGITVIDSLILAPGKSYQLKSGVVQTINEYFQILGNNCSSIELSATQVGSRADILINDFEVVGDFIQMRDIRIENNEASYAGIHSTDIANSNQGWIFEDAPSETSEEVGFFGDDRVLCNDASIQLEAYPFNANATFLWNDGSTNNELEVTTPGTYFARVTFEGNCSIIDTIQILPQDEFAVVLGNDTTLCENETLLLDVSVSGATYLWQDGSTDALFNVTESGVYSVDVNLGGCSISDTINVGYVSISSIELGDDQTICENETADFDVTVTGATYLWNDGSMDPTYSTTVAGKYWVDVTSSNCTATDTVNIMITPLADVTLGADTTLCEGLLFNVMTDVVADSYSWSTGSTTNATDLPEGTHYLDVTLDGCTATDTIVVNYKPFPNIQLGADTVLCSDEMIFYDFVGTADSYLWSDGTSLPTFTIMASGEYAIEAELDNCVLNDTITALLIDYPDFNLGVDTTLCEGTILTLDGSSNEATQMIWQDMSMENTYDVSISGKYYLDAFNGRCLTSDTINVVFNPKPVFDLGQDKTQCIGDVLDLDATTTGATYLWSDGNTDPINSYSTPGDHWVDVTLNDCTVRDTVNLSFIQIPAAALGSDTTLCEGDVLNYDFSNLNLAYEWNDMDASAIKSINNPGLYWLEVTDRDCASRDSINIDFTTRPVVDLGRDTMLCEGEMISLGVNPLVDEMVEWIDGTNGNTYDVSSTGVYWVEVNKLGCVVRDEIIITFNQPPSLDLGMDTLICEQAPLVLSPGITNAEYRWQDGSTETSYRVDRPGVYQVEILKGGCTVTDEIEIDTRRCTFYRAYFPEAFTPNSDGVNDTYYPQFASDLLIMTYEFTIYDRWGNLLFQTEDPTSGWDGTFDAKPLNTGTYIYTLKIDYVDDRGPGSRLQRGEFLIMR